MDRNKLSTEELIDRWEARRCIKNIMGKYASCIILNRVADIFTLFWSKSHKDISMGFNDGGYSGQDAVKAYYDALHDKNVLTAKLIQEKFPEHLGDKNPDEIYGIGPLSMKSLSTPVIEIAEEGQTAKGLWYCLGSCAEVSSAGPVANWVCGYYAVDFVLEDDEWKIWHLLNVNDIDHPCGQDWTKEAVPFPELPEFSALKDLELPEYTFRGTMRRLYSTSRPFTPPPRIPEPYGAFAETFSYGI